MTDCSTSQHCCASLPVTLRVHRFVPSSDDAEIAGRAASPVSARTALSSRPLVRMYGNVFAICAAVAVLAALPDWDVPPALTRNVIEAVYCGR